MNTFRVHTFSLLLALLAFATCTSARANSTTANPTLDATALVIDAQYKLLVPGLPAPGTSDAQAFYSRTGDALLTLLTPAVDDEPTTRRSSNHAKYHKSGMGRNHTHGVNSRRGWLGLFYKSGRKSRSHGLNKHTMHRLFYRR